MILQSPSVRVFSPQPIPKPYWKPPFLFDRFIQQKRSCHQNDIYRWSRPIIQRSSQLFDGQETSWHALWSPPSSMIKHVFWVSAIVFQLLRFLGSGFSKHASWDLWRSLILVRSFLPKTQRNQGIATIYLHARVSFIFLFCSFSWPTLIRNSAFCYYFSI